MNRCHLKGSNGDSLHAVLCAAGFNIRWLLRMIAKKGIGFFCASYRPAVWGTLANNCERFLSTNRPNQVQCVWRLHENEFFRVD